MPLSPKHEILILLYFEDDGTGDILVSKFRTRDSRRQVDAGVLRYADLVGHATLPLEDTG